MSNDFEDLIEYFQNISPDDLEKLGRGIDADGRPISGENTLTVHDRFFAEDQKEKAPKRVIDFEGLAHVFQEIEQEFVGMQAAKDLLWNIAAAEVARIGRFHTGDIIEKPSNHIVLTGNPGTGKTTIARYIGRIMHAAGYLVRPDVVEVTRKDLVAGYIGQTAIKTAGRIQEAMGAVLFVDEAGAMAQEGRDFGKESIQALLPALENSRGNFICVMASYAAEMETVFDLDDGVRSRFQHHCHLRDFTFPEMQVILRKAIKKQNICLTGRALDALDDIIEQCTDHADPRTYGNGRLIRNIVEMLGVQQRVPNVKTFDFRIVYGRAAENAKGGVLTETAIAKLKPAILQQAGFKGNDGPSIGFTAKIPGSVLRC